MSAPLNRTSSRLSFYMGLILLTVFVTALIARFIDGFPAGNLARTALSHTTLAMMSTGTCLIVSFCLAGLIFRCRSILSLNWMAAAFGTFLVVETLNHALDSSCLGADNVLSQFGRTHVGILNLLDIIGALAAIATLCGLPSVLRLIYVTVEMAANSHRNELRFNAAAESSMSAILMLESVKNHAGEIVDFVIVTANRNAARMLGAKRRALLGKSLAAVSPELGAKEKIGLYQKVTETGEASSLDFSGKLIGSQPKASHHHLHVVKLEEGISLTLTDVSERRASEAALKSALEHKQAIIACSPFCTIVTDQDGIITSVNPAAERMLWYSAAEMVGQNVSMIHDVAEMEERAKELADQFSIKVPATEEVFQVMPEQGIADDREWTYVRKDGSRVPVQLVVTALKNQEGANIGFMGVSYDLTERKKSDDYVQHVAHHDPLTDLPTRTLLRDRLEIAIERAKRSGEQLGLVMIDLDNFKRVNDSLGHQAGDKLLCEVSRRLKDCLRKSDTVARMGGDEFVVLLSDLHGPEDAKSISTKILESLSKPICIERHDLTVTASLGISMYPEAVDLDSLMKHADMAMYQAKGRGRNNVEIYNPRMGMESLKKLQMESALRVALQTGEFEIVYQPQISFGSNRMTGIEALLRWNSPEFGNVPPTTFIAIAEETGFIVPLGEWVLNSACKQIAALQLEIGRKLSLAVNISPRQFQQKNFPDTVERALRLSGLDPAQLELEITEQLLMVDSEESLEIMKRVRRLGVRFAIDDFGTGFSNMAYITRFAVDRIKIDRSFISKCDADTNSKVVTSAIIALAHSLEIEVIAEGVETSGHVDTLQEMSCDSAQGYLYARPLQLRDLKSYATKLPSIPRHFDGRSGIRLAFTNINEAVMQRAS